MAEVFRQVEEEAMQSYGFGRAVLFVTLTGVSWAQVTQRVSVDSGGVQGNGESGYGWNGSARGVSISSDGRYVAFESVATNLIPGDTNALRDIFIRDRQSGTTERVSVDSGGVQTNDLSSSPSISADGRYVAFDSFATNLVPGDTNASVDVFVHDRQLGTTERVSVDSGGVQGNWNSFTSSISADGRYVTFRSIATNLVPGDTNNIQDVFVRDRQNGTTERVSLDSSGGQANDFSFDPSISADGRYVAFVSNATNLVLGDTNGFYDVFIHDRQNGTTERVSVDSGGAEGNGSSYWPSVSADGRYVAFYSSASNLVPGDSNLRMDVFVRDRQSGTTELVSVAVGGGVGNDDSLINSISADGRLVAFGSYATNLVLGSLGGFNVFIRNRQSGTTERISVDSGGAQGNGDSGLGGLFVSGQGRHVAFGSLATNLVSGDTNSSYDAFVHDRDAAGFTSLCDPGVAGVHACPCSNPPSGADRGCNNSSSTGGASLAAAGIAYLSMDSLVFTTSGERLTALSIVWQGPTSAAAGIVYGQGVRCVNGSLKRLYNKSASGGSITAPNFGGGDPTISARSAALGVPIQAGQSRYYFVSYRDPIVLGGCPASSTLNVTQTGRVDWSF